MDALKTNNDLKEYNFKDFENDVIGVNTEELLNLFKYKQNIILQGAPGVGKTYIARRLCWLMMGCKDNSKIIQVQFHSGYSYEDFVKGLKPNENNGFKFENGPFYKICLRANRDRQHNYFLIIDEINRGNISSILGEAFSLIEKDHRDEIITIKYNNEQFAVPKNLYIIGTMNTADRGLKTMDYALRRRFSFYDIKPIFGSEKFRVRMQMHNNMHLIKVLRQIKLLNKEISEDINLGPGYVIGHSYFCTKIRITDNILNNILEYEIIPLLKEYWSEDIENRAEKWEQILKGCLIDRYY